MLKRLYDWVMGWADSPYGTPALFLLALAESSFFPIPPDILLMALAIAKPRRALFYAGVCTGGSVLGGMIGYLIGLEFYELMGRHIIEFYGVSDEFDYVGSQYQANAFVAVAIAGFTPIPYKVFTIAAGVFRIPLVTLVAASLVGRSGRFFLVGVLIRIFGPTIKRTIDRYLNILSILFVVFLVGGFVVVKLVMDR
ncbi:MAG: YqaA family protein [Candidatus Latescibacteria bacterium]|nr:YqaA family protein [Candidatus Latescibacterota bacterium]